MPVSIFRDRNASRSYPVVRRNLQVRTELARCFGELYEMDPRVWTAD